MNSLNKLTEIMSGMIEFNSSMEEKMSSIKTDLDKVLNTHYQANHTPYAVMKIEDEAHYWEEVLADSINRVEFPDYDSLDIKGVELLKQRTYVIIRGNLKSGNTIRFNKTNFNQLYINGEYYTGNYTFNGETPETYERLVIVAVQTPFNLGQDKYGNLDMLVTDFPIEDFEIFVNIGQFSNLQPNIDELLMADTADSLYVRGDWVFNSSFYSPIKVFSVTNIFNTNGWNWNWSNIRDLSLPNTTSVPYKNQPGTYRNVDISNATGSIQGTAFSNAKIRGTLRIPKITTINAEAFTNCTEIEYVELGNAITSMSTGAFSGCKNLKEINMPDTITGLGQSVFSSCLSLKRAQIGNSIATLENAVFSSCSSLEELILGKNMTSISTSAFNGCISLKIIKVNKGYHCPVTPINQSKIIDWRCFLDILENCAINGEDGRTAATMTFKVSSVVRTELTNAYNEGDETALAIYELMDSKSISITT